MGFTNYIQQIKDSGGTTHDLVDSSASHYVQGTQTESTNVWTGALPDGVTAYYDGLSIDYFLPYAGTSTAATLNLGGKGAKPVYVGNGNGGVTTHFPQYAVIHMTYIVNSSLNSGNGCWKASAYYDSNTNVKQTATTTSANYEVLFSATADNTTRTEGARKNSNLLFNPSTGNLQATQLNGVTIGSSPKFTDNNTTYSAGTGLSLSSTTFSLATSGATAGSYGPSADASPGHSGTFSVPYVTVDTYGRVTGISTKTITLPASGNTDTKVSISNTNPTTGTWYYPTWHTATSGTGVTLNANDGLRYYALQGTASALGHSYLQLGNSTAEGTAGNKQGHIRIYAKTAKYTDIVSNASGDNRTITLPDASGTVHLASNPTLAKTGTSTIDLAASSTYTLTAGGGSVVFKTPPNTTYSAGTGLSLSGTTFSAKLGYTTSGNNRAVQADSDGNLYVTQKDTNTYVTQTATTTNSSYRVLLSGTADDTTRTEGACKSTGLQFNASTRNLYVSSGTTNGNLYLGLATSDSLYTAINALGWVSAVIE